MRGDRPSLSCQNMSFTAFTPHARGSTSRMPYPSQRVDVYPACAGIDPLRYSTHHPRNSLPRMRGDRPLLPLALRRLNSFTPHARGSTDAGAGQDSAAPVYPACAGIDRWPRPSASLATRLPRMRGDRPLPAVLIAGQLVFTPHARGSTSVGLVGYVLFWVYPACAGIDPCDTMEPNRSTGLPRMRGDRPDLLSAGSASYPFTPHARGSTLVTCRIVYPDGVYPACAGIDPGLPPLGFFAFRLPRMRGDRPHSLRSWRVLNRFTPHARGSTP